MGEEEGIQLSSVEFETASMPPEKPIIMRSTLTLRNFPTTVFETVPLFTRRRGRNTEGRRWRKKKETVSMPSEKPTIMPSTPSLRHFHATVFETVPLFT